MKNIMVVLCLLCGVIICNAQPAANAIRINQLGYYVNAPKIAVIAAAVPANDFYIISTTKKDTVFTGRLGEPMQSANSSLTTRIADFSSFHTAGTYVVVVPNLPPSYSFYIGNNANHAVATAALKGYYYMRVSMPLEAPYAGK